MSGAKIHTAVVGALMALALFAAPVTAASVDTSNPAFAATSGPTSIPIGAAEFCQKHREECAPNASVVDAVELTQALWTELLGINAHVNATVKPVTDQDLYQVAEYWTYPSGFGDCEDIALEKRRELIAAGWAASTLMIAVVREKDGAGHAVLMVRTDRGDLILDNQDGMVLVWTETPYRYLKRQSQANPGQWVDILDDRTEVITASN